MFFCSELRLRGFCLWSSGKLWKILRKIEANTLWEKYFSDENDGDDGVNAKQHFISRKAFVIARWREEF